MTDEDLRLLAQTIDRQGTISGDDARLLLAEVRRLRASPQRERAIDYGSEERHDRPRPFSHQHHHAHYGARPSAYSTPEHTGDFSHPHRHGQDDDHHR